MRINGCQGRADEQKNPTIFLWWGTAQAVKRTRTHAMTLFRIGINPLISLHCWTQETWMDALDVYWECSFLWQYFGFHSYVVYDPHAIASDISRAIETSRKRGNESFPKSHCKMVTDRSLLIMVDHSKTALTLSKESHQEFQRIIVIDHHRQDDSFLKNVLITYPKVEPKWVPSGWLVELIQFPEVERKIS